MKNFVNHGQEIKIVAAADHSSGDLIQVGSLVGVAINDAKTGEKAIVYLGGVYEVPKLLADVMTQGAPLFLDAGNGWLTLVDTGVPAGHVYEDADGTQDKVQAKLL